MQLVIFGFFGIIILVLFVFAETNGKKILGVFASLLMLMLGVWCISDAISFETGSTLTGTNTKVLTSLAISDANSTNTTTNSITTLNQTTNSTYTAAPAPSFSPLPFSGLIALILLLLSLFGLLHYGLSVGREINE